MDLLLQTTNLSAAVIYVLIVVLVVRRIRQLRIGFSPLVLVLLAYFLVRAVDLLAAPDPLLGYSPALDAVTDVLVIAMLLYLLARASRLAAATLDTVGQAQLRVAEYDRARRDYSIAVHAKVAGPLSVIAGAAQSLEAHGEDPEARARLSELITDAAAALQLATAELDAVRAAADDASRRQADADTLTHTAVSATSVAPADSQGR